MELLEGGFGVFGDFLGEYRDCYHFLNPESFQRLERFKRIERLLSRSWILLAFSSLNQKMSRLALARLMRFS